jgi:hypothetical protein
MGVQERDERGDDFLHRLVKLRFSRIAADESLDKAGEIWAGLRLAAGNLHAAAHVFTTALGRFDLAVTIRTLGDVDRFAAVELQRVVDQLFVTRATRHRANAHAALGTAIDRHGHSPLEILRCVVP